MMIPENIKEIRKHVPEHVKLICVSKFHGIDEIMEAYAYGERHFGESRVQELVDKQPHLPEDIEWHFIGHLQRNKIKFIIGFIDLIHGVDSIRLLRAINNQAEQAGRVVRCLLQIHIADESSKFGFEPEQVRDLLVSDEFVSMKNVEIAGLMGMATYTEDEEQVRAEFRSLKELFDEIKENYFFDKATFNEVSMGMSGDYKIAIEEGSTMIRLGTVIFGERG